jgi:hypothetical protein
MIYALSVTNIMHKFLFSYNVTLLYMLREVEGELQSRSPSTYALHDLQDHSQRMTIPDVVYIKFGLLKMSKILLETCRGV